MELSAIALYGLDHAQASLEQTAGRLAYVAAPGSDGQPTDIVDVATAMVELAGARQEFATNVKVAQVAGQMERRALDLLA